MPTIQGPKEESVLPTGNLPYQSSAGATPEAFGGGIAQGTGQAAANTDQMAMRAFAIKNETDNVNAQTELMARTQDLQNGNADKGIVGFRTLIGQNAIDALPDYQKKVKDAYDDVRSSLSPAAARMFDFMGSRIMRGTTDAMGSYGAQQQVVGAHQAARSRVALAQQGALTYADDPDGWNAHISDVQTASVAGSALLGLPPNGIELQRREDLGKVYIDRTKQLMARDPMEAATFYHGNIGMVPAEHRWELEHALKTTTDGQYAHHDGQDAYQSAIGQASAPALPQPVAGADSVKPFDQKRIDQVASFVKSTTPWENEINAAAKTYGVNPAEIKLKIAIESGGNPQAVNPEGGHGDHATGLGQFTAATAARYGITDRNDPVQSINGIAKMLAGNGGTVGGDMSKADRAYFGGNVNAKGPNTDQYVENTRAARQAIFGGGAPAPMTAADLEGREGAILTAAGAQAEQRRPGDSAYASQVKNAAHAQWAQDVQALKGQDYANFTQVFEAAQKTGATTISDLPPEVQQTMSKLDPQHVAGIQAQFDRNLRAANGEYAKSDPKIVNDLAERVFLPDGDPRKIVNPGQLGQYVAHGLNPTDYEKLGKLIQSANNPDGNPFLHQVNDAKSNARARYKAMVGAAPGMLQQQHPEIGEEAAYAFNADLDAKIAAARKAGKDPQTLLTPGSPDFALDPSKVAAFMPTEAKMVERAANAPKPGAPPRAAAPASPAALAFASEAEATAAAAAGKIKSGDRIKIGNQTGTWH